MTRVLASIYSFSAVLDGVLVAFNWSQRGTEVAQVFDTVLTIVILPMEAFPLVLVGYALFKGKRFDSARWLVAILALLDQMLLVLATQ